jgi:hypothetical protein
MSICSYWPKDAHLELDEIYNIPFFTAHLNLLSQEFGGANEASFRHLLSFVNRISLSLRRSTLMSTQAITSTN